MWDRVTISIAPASEPVTGDETASHMDVTYSDDDVMIDAMIKSAVNRIDGPSGVGIACVTQTWKLSLDCFPTDAEIKIPGWPIKSITSVSYIDTDGVSQTVDGADYQLDIAGDQARLNPVYGGSWPAARNINGAVTILYVVGEPVGSVREDIKLAIKQMVAHWYENREAVSDLNLSPIPMGASTILSQFRRGSIAA